MPPSLVCGARLPAIFPLAHPFGPNLPCAVTVADAVECFDLLEVVVGGFELPSQPFDVAVDGSVIDIDMLAISRVDQLVAVLDVAGPMSKGLE